MIAALLSFGGLTALLSIGMLVAGRHEPFRWPDRPLAWVKELVRWTFLFTGIFGAFIVIVVMW